MNDMDDQIGVRLQQQVNRKGSMHARPSMLVERPTYLMSLDEEDTTSVQNNSNSLVGSGMMGDNPYGSTFHNNSTLTGGGNDLSSFADSYSGSEFADEDLESFASETSDGILSPAEIERTEKNIIALKEHQRVFRARIFVLILLMITAVSNAVIVYFLTYNSEYVDYENHNNELAKEVQAVTESNIYDAFRSMDAMSIALTTRVLDDPGGLGAQGVGGWSPSTGGSGGDHWPMVTFPNFPELAHDVRNVSGAIQVTLVPIVTESKRLEWEQYSVYNQGWLISEDHIEYYRTRRLQRLLSAASNNNTSTNTSSSTATLESLQQPPDYSYPFSSTVADVVGVESLRYPPLPPKNQQKQRRQSELIVNQSSSQEALALPPQQQYQRRQSGNDHSFRGVVPARIHPPPTREERQNDSTIYAPVWQMSPPPYYRGIVNYDMYNEPSFQRLSQIVNETGQAVISNLLNDDLVEVLLGDPNAQVNAYSQYYPSYVKPSQGKKHPPCSILIQPVWQDRANVNNPNLVAYLVALIPWENYLVDAFRPGIESALARYKESDCDSVSLLNYRLKGGESVLFLGDKEQFPGYDTYDYTMTSRINFPTQPPANSFEQTQFLVLDPNFTLTGTNGTNATANSNGTTPRVSKPQPTDCTISIYLSPSFEMKAVYVSNLPIYYSLMIVATFGIFSFAFFIYDLMAERRRGRVMAVAEKTGRIVTGLFPGQFADQLIAEDKQKEKDAKKKKKKVVIEEAPTRQLKKFMASKKESQTKPNSDPLGYGNASPDSGGGETPLFLAQSKPIADLFPETTVLFADIAGFTAWSSVREPSQVFTLLETVYQNFDHLAKQYGVFKIETIGDCYVAVCGLPEPRADHAVAMSRFSLACMQKMKSLVSHLEVSLGPDTGDLTMRFGLHSGPVTAGVLRGERARFQLFGDTVNTAARMESTGLRDKIQISQETADLLIAAGKSHWFTKRDGLVHAKGKGELQTYWLASSTIGRRTTMDMRRRHSLSGARASSRNHVMGDSMNASSSILAISAPVTGASGRNLSGHDSHQNLLGPPLSAANSGDSGRIPSFESQRVLHSVNLSKKQQRLVDWNCELIQQLIRQIVARRNFLKNVSKPLQNPLNVIKDLPKIGGMMIQQGTSTMPLDEVVEVINLPEFEVAAYHGNTDAKHIKLDPSVVFQLRKFVANVASKYRDNPFHNFEHASHVTMSVSKLLTRIVAPDLASINDRHDNKSGDLSSSLHLTNDMKDLHDHTYGITSDPLTQLAVVLSALIHDVDHRGVSNAVLAKEEPEMATKYRNKSIAEQNSVDIAWTLFMDETCRGLRDTICPEYTELRRFRQLIVSSVLATDIFDPELSSLRKARWTKAFPPPETIKPTEEVRIGQRRMTALPRPSMLQNTRNSFPVGLSTRNLGGGGNTNNSLNNNQKRHDINRKATIVIEHLIQASDVSHTMQHWHIYQKWNECLFQEMYNAYKDGRTDKDPSDGWYKGEIWFFDNYVIPLAKKLKECGVFGVSSDEYLDYAVANRNEWEEKGEAIVRDMIFKYKDARGRIDKAALGYG